MEKDKGRKILRRVELCLDMGCHARIKDIAEKEDYSVTRLVQVLIEEGLRKYDEDPSFVRKNELRGIKRIGREVGAPRKFLNWSVTFRNDRGVFELRRTVDGRCWRIYVGKTWSRGIAIEKIRKWEKKWVEPDVNGVDEGKHGKDMWCGWDVHDLL